MFGEVNNVPTRQFYLNNERDLKLQLICKKLGKKIPEALGEAVSEWIEKHPDIELQINGKEETI